MNKDYLRVFRAFSDERRLRVLELLRQGEQCACVLLQELEISQPTLSYHMKILCRSGIVRERQVISLKPQIGFLMRFLERNPEKAFRESVRDLSSAPAL